jgi:2-succinyl-5-enolpyruvyl-6-hydroxy-3-cyclohexene-1-carboxylate synthase
MNTGLLNTRKAHRVVEELHRHQVQHVILCPGARNTPLLAAFEQHAAFTAFSVLDERAAAFVALGLLRAQANHSELLAPACIVTTSGTAALNLLPAIAEAAQEGLPLLVVTADRSPSEQIVGANQSLPQRAALAPLCLASFEIPFSEAASLCLLRVDQAVAATLSPFSGPVHLNVPFGGNLLMDLGREKKQPAQTDENASHLWMAQETEEDLFAWSGSSSPFLREMPMRSFLTSADGDDLMREMNQAQSPVLILGNLLSAKDRQAALTLADQLKWPCFLDAGSGFRLGQRPQSSLLNHEFLDLHAMKTDFVLQIGKRLVSKRLSQAFPEARSVVVDPHLETQDPLIRGGLRYRLSPSVLVDVMQPHVRAGSELITSKSPAHKARLAHLLQKDASMTKQWGEDLKSNLPELCVVHTAVEALPEGFGLFTGNSLAIRHLDVLSWNQAECPAQATQRGCSGIDGLLATALGFAKEHCRQSQSSSLALLGDLSLLHDLSSLHIWKQEKVPLVLLCINNSGGGIFHQLPQAMHPEVLSPWCDAAHEQSLSPVVAGFGLPTWKAHDTATLRLALQEAFESGRGFIEFMLPRGAHARTWIPFAKKMRDLS